MEKIIEINGNAYHFFNESSGTRNGFRHTSRLYKNSREVNRYHIHYLNRTWEAYTYQSVMQSVVDDIIQRLKNKIIEEYKTKNGVKRLSPKHIANITALCEANAELQELYEVHSKL